MKFRKILTLIAAPLLACAVQAQGRTDAAGDQTLIEMGQAFRQGQKARLTQLLPQARGHLLEPWAAYWELRARLDTASAQEVQEFYTRYAGTYQEDRLRNDWLLLLGQRRDWTALAEEHPRFRMNDDPQVRCYALLVQQLREGTTPALVDEVRRLWQAQREAEDGCTTAARNLAGPGNGPRLAPLDIWRKARHAAEHNRTRAALAAVEIVAPEASAQAGEALANPARYIANRVGAMSRTRKELATLALVRIAANDPEVAAAAMNRKWELHLTPEERNWVWGVIGRQAAQRLQPGALAHYAKVTRAADLNDEMLAWKVRAALRAGSQPDWKTVITAVNAMSPASQQDPAWTYWRARGHLAIGPESDKAEARRQLTGLASPRGFYEQLALEELGQKITLPARPAPLTAEEREAARRNPGLARALHAIAIGLRADGVREWNYTTNLARPGGMADRELLAAAALACDREVWDRCINTSDRTRGEFDAEQRFPMPFRESVVKRTGEISLDPAYVYGLIRQESRFIMDARSHVGASGLMQVMPATARWTARRIGLNNFTPNQINDRETNIAIGTGYLKIVLEDFAGSLPLAAAAYNAGPSRPRAWRNGPVMEGAAWAENVPFHETRDYVKKVLANTTAYAALLTGQPQSLKARLGTVGPRDPAQPEPNREIP
jgi:soluble lytic murein transglycosylase